MFINTGPIEGRQRIVRVSGNTGKVRKVIGINFLTQSEAYDFATNELGLPALDLDNPLTWIMANGDLIKIEVIGR